MPVFRESSTKWSMPVFREHDLATRISTRGTSESPSTTVSRVTTTYHVCVRRTYHLSHRNMARCGGYAVWSCLCSLSETSRGTVVSKMVVSGRTGGRTGSLREGYGFLGPWGRFCQGWGSSRHQMNHRKSGIFSSSGPKSCT